MAYNKDIDRKLALFVLNSALLVRYDNQSKSLQPTYTNHAGWPVLNIIRCTYLHILACSGFPAKYIHAIMNNLLFISLGLILWQLPLQSALAQHSLFDAQRSLQMTSPTSLAFLKNQLDLEDIRYAISPDDTVFSGKKSEEKRLLRENNAFMFRHFHKRINGATGLNAEQMSPEQAAAVDQGILFNPAETHTPAAIVITPLHNVDPAMIHNPGPMQERTAIERNILLLPEKKQP